MNTEESTKRLGADAVLSRRDLGRYAAISAGLAALRPAVAAAAGSRSGASAFLARSLQQANKGGTVNVARAGDADTLDPQHTIDGFSLEILYRIYDTLTAVNPATQD